MGTLRARWALLAATLVAMSFAWDNRASDYFISDRLSDAISLFKSSNSSISAELFDATAAAARDQEQEDDDEQDSAAFGTTNFDFDDRLIAEEAGQTATDDDDDQLFGMNQSADDNSVAQEDGEEENEAEEEEENEEDDEEESAALSEQQGFLPWSCHHSCSSSPTCKKYLDHEIVAKDALDKAVMYSGSNKDIQRVLRRQIRNHLIGLARGTGQVKTKRPLRDERPFQILVLGGSVSNCRSVDPATTCWHARMYDWFHEAVPLEGDAGFEMALAKYNHKRKQLSKRASRHPSRRMKRKKPRTRLINVARSATGSAFFAYCFDEQMRIRGKAGTIASGVDLVVLEFGVNDVYPLDEQATRDLERLVRTIKTLPSKPAIVMLEAASLLLARTADVKTNAEFLHLPVAKHYDIPLLSVKRALFGEANEKAASADLDSLFLDDLHHPNEKGHELMADVLTAYLEKQACQIQSDALTESFDKSTKLYERVEPSAPVSLPQMPLFAPTASTDKKAHTYPRSVCHQVGNDKTDLEPIENTGWSRFSWARDKQYLVADVPGSKITFRVDVAEGGQILLDWLRSQFYSLGDALVYLDGNRSKGRKVAGYWDLGWSIGVPTALFENVPKGSHEVTIELLGLDQSSHPAPTKTHFRLIGIVTT